MPPRKLDVWSPWAAHGDKIPSTVQREIAATLQLGKVCVRLDRGDFDGLDYGATDRLEAYRPGVVADVRRTLDSVPACTYVHREAVPIASAYEHAVTVARAGVGVVLTLESASPGVDPGGPPFGVQGNTRFAYRRLHGPGGYTDRMLLGRLARALCEALAEDGVTVAAVHVLKEPWNAASWPGGPPGDWMTTWGPDCAGMVWREMRRSRLSPTPTVLWEAWSPEGGPLGTVFPASLPAGVAVGCHPFSSPARGVGQEYDYTRDVVLAVRGAFPGHPVWADEQALFGGSDPDSVWLLTEEGSAKAAAQWQAAADAGAAVISAFSVDLGRPGEQFPSTGRGRPLYTWLRAYDPATGEQHASAAWYTWAEQQRPPQPPPVEPPKEEAAVDRKLRDHLVRAARARRKALKEELDAVPPDDPSREWIAELRQALSILESIRKLDEEPVEPPPVEPPPTSPLPESEQRAIWSVLVSGVKAQLVRPKTGVERGPVAVYGPRTRDAGGRAEAGTYGVGQTVAEAVAHYERRTGDRLPPGEMLAPRQVAAMRWYLAMDARQGPTAIRRAGDGTLHAEFWRPSTGSVHQPVPSIVAAVEFFQRSGL